MEKIYLITFISFLGPLLGSIGGILFKLKQRGIFLLLSFTAGVMLAISFLQLVPESLKVINLAQCFGGLIAGFILVYLLNKLAPHPHHKFHLAVTRKDKIKQAATFLFIGLFLHNFPEGFAIGISSQTNFHMSISIALAIAIHDIAETFCTSTPYYYLTRSSLKTIGVSLSTFIPTLLGIIASFYLSQIITTNTLSIITAMTAGIMIYISLFELIPSSVMQINKKREALVSLFIGVVFVILLGMI